MEYAAEENLLIYFLFDLHLTHDILKEAYKIQATQKTSIPNKFIDKLKLAITKKEKFRKINEDAELSGRELDTLRLIAEDLSNQEIADKLFISLNTVKTHLKNINIKLEVNNRTKAVIKAKELRIIS